MRRETGGERGRERRKVRILGIKQDCEGRQRVWIENVRWVMVKVRRRRERERIDSRK